jgi:L-cysteine S-thiosulfotransferase
MRPGILFSVVGSLTLTALAIAYAQMAAPGPWKSRAIPEAQGKLKEVDGKKTQVRYKEVPFAGREDFSAWRTYAYTDNRPPPPVSKVSMPTNVKGDPKLGRKLFMDRGRGPCTGCHLIQGDDVWPAGNIGPDLSVYGDRLLPDEFVYQMIYDPRLFFPNTVMPPWGTVGIFKPEEIVHLLTFLKTQKGNPPFVPPPEKDPARNPFMRKKSPSYFGDNLDAINNPAVLVAEDAQALWMKRGPAGKACAGCHGDGSEKSMKGVATKYPKYLSKYQRVMSIEDFLTVHAPETTGIEMLSESADNINMAILIKMQSNGMPVNLDLKSPEMKAALGRGKAVFEKKVGMRNHACADCHTNAPGKGANKFLGGRLLDDVETGLANHFPVWLTGRGSVWDIRKRFQWCMLPIGMNYLPADSVEYAELELYLTSFAHGKPMNVPGIR